MEKLSERLTNLNNISKNILKYGLFIVFIAFVISSVLLKGADSILTLNIAREFTCGNVYAFCEIIIGAIAFDMLIGKNDR